MRLCGAGRKHRAWRTLHASGQAAKRYQMARRSPTGLAGSQDRRPCWVHDGRSLLGRHDGGMARATAPRPWTQERLPVHTPVLCSVLCTRPACVLFSCSADQLRAAIRLLPAIACCRAVLAAWGQRHAQSRDTNNRATALPTSGPRCVLGIPGADGHGPRWVHGRNGQTAKSGGRNPVLIFRFFVALSAKLAGETGRAHHWNFSWAMGHVRAHAIRDIRDP